MKSVSLKSSANYDEYKAEQRKERKADKKLREMRRNRKWQWSE